MNSLAARAKICRQQWFMNWAWVKMGHLKIVMNQLTRKHTHAYREDDATQLRRSGSASTMRHSRNQLFMYITHTSVARLEWCPTTDNTDIDGNRTTTTNDSNESNNNNNDKKKRAHKRIMEWEGKGLYATLAQAGITPIPDSADLCVYVRRQHTSSVQNSPIYPHSYAAQHRHV